MRSGEDFRQTIRRGAKGVQPTLVTHVVSKTDGPTAVGFVVSKSVGSAVERNRVKRQLRHLMRDRLHQFPPGCSVVVRALPASSGAGSAMLAEHLDAALSQGGVR